jgi:iron complex transport system substrate-binding protein
VSVRVVSLTCSNTEILCALGLGHWLVGVDDHSDHPPEVVARAQRVGPDLDIDVAAVAALRPDLVLASLTVPGHERIVAQLDAAGIPYLAPEPIRLTDVYRDLRQIGDALGARAAAERCVAEMEAAMPPVHRVGRRPRVAVEWWPKPVILAGRRSWIHDLIARAGGENAWDRDCKSAPAPDEEVAAHPPDAVVIAWCGVPAHRYRPDVVARRPGWQTFPALQNGQIWPITEAWLGRPGPRLVEGYRALVTRIASIPTLPEAG